MKDNVATEATRLRPLSGGLWTIFSWLRRDERSSTESISSSGSDHTATSFSFLSPAQYRTNSKHFILPSGPVTDTYKERVRERNIRRQIECDLTLRRKYGLFRGECASNYNTLTLPTSSKSKSENFGRLERDRRATSECGQRRAPYVVGKRRAPLPPNQNYIPVASTSSTRRARKRPAPPPPIKLTETKDKINIENSIEMNTNTDPNKIKNKPICKLEHNNKECGENKKVKGQSEKGFLKNFFESKKRNSVSEFSANKLLPNISELDKEAVEIIKKSKERNITISTALQENNWICTSCLRKYSSAIDSCLFCDQQLNLHVSTQTEKDAKSKNPEKVENEKLQLKKLLKEMKDSLPKKSRGDNNKSSHSVQTFVNTPTLPIGSSSKQYSKRKYEISSLGQEKNRFSGLEDVRPTKEIILPSTSENNNQNTVKDSPPYDDAKVKLPKVDFEKRVEPLDKDKKSTIFTETVLPKIDETVELGTRVIINEPIKVVPTLNSDNLRSVYVEKNIPKNNNKNMLENKNNRVKENCELNKNEIFPLLSKHPSKAYNKNITPEAKYIPDVMKLENKAFNSINQPSIPDNIIKKSEYDDSQKFKFTSGCNVATTLNMSENKTKLNVTIKQDEENKKIDLKKFKNSNTDQYARRRELINLLEKSIAKGDERGAADAAAGLAQLRLSCSVLSFSSNIVADKSLIKDKVEDIPMTNKAAAVTKEQNKIVKIDSATQSGTEDILKMKPDHNKKNINKVQSDTSTSNQSTFGITAGNVLSKPSTSFPTKDIQKHENIFINVWVEDKEAARGPVPLQVSRRAVMRDLRQQAETAFGIASHLQRWIVGRTLCTTDSTPLIALAGPELDAPFYLCLVESDTSSKLKCNTDETEKGNSPPCDRSGKPLDLNVYTELMQLEKHAIVTNNEIFECAVCLEECEKGEGAVLRDCVHSFCKNCLSDVVRHSQEAIVTCPATGCNGVIQEREIRALVSLEEYERWLARGLAAAESGTRNSFHCRTKDCTGWALCEPGVRRFPCPVCKHVNCVPCQAIHEGETCEQHRKKLQEAEKIVEGNQIDDGTKILFENLITRGEALECPECKAMIIKKWGCDWVKCLACKTEICWITRGRRWGPGGRGDVSGGCRCGVDGKRCHPSCGYCH